MYARMGFAVAAHVDADVLLVDEVLSVGDYLFQQRCVERMTEVLRSGTTVLFVSHNLRAVSELCHRGLLLEHGRVVTVGPARDVIQTYLGRGVGRAGDRAALTSVTMEGPERHYGGVRVRGPGRVTVDVKPHQLLEDMTVVLSVRDEQDANVFDTCTQRLGAGPLTAGPGGSLRCTSSSH